MESSQSTQTFYTETANVNQSIVIINITGHFRKKKHNYRPRVFLIKLQEKIRWNHLKRFTQLIYVNEYQKNAMLLASQYLLDKYKYMYMFFDTIATFNVI